ncbi:MAG TPA: hypothetical protein ENJ82_10520 [Bacteroidetes bacterium]|nr:hypothetical protein [Bacteroidota bacterium]
MPIKPRLRPSAEFSSSSIADIVFLLLIFFLLTSNFVTQDAVQVDLPRSDSDKPATGEVAVTITADGTYKWKNKEIGLGKSRAEKEEILVAEIDAYLMDSTTENRVINLRGDTSISYGAAAVVIAAVARNGGSVAIQTQNN